MYTETRLGSIINQLKEYEVQNLKLRKSAQMAEPSVRNGDQGQTGNAAVINSNLQTLIQEMNMLVKENIMLQEQ